MSESLFAFIFRLTPWEGCLNLNFDRKALAPNFGTVCTRDQLVLFWLGPPENNDGARGTAYLLARALVHAHAYRSFPNGHVVLSVEPVSWVEVRNCKTAETVTGYMHPTLATTSLHPDHPDNKSLLAAVDLVHTMVTHPQSAPLQMALSDFYVAVREGGPYSAFYAYRVLEDVGFSFGVVKGDKPNWNAMNEALGTTEEKWRPLTEAGTQARHLSDKSLASLSSVNREALLALAHEALTLVLKLRL